MREGHDGSKRVTRMKLPRHATYFLIFLGLITLFQVALGSDLIVLAALVAVSASGLYPMTRKTFDPADLLMLSFSFYYGTFSLILKSIVLQPVQMNLQVPYLTAFYLVSGYGLIFISYLFVTRVMTKYYRGTRLRSWTLFERVYADESFLARYTLPLSIVSLVLITVVSFFSHSAQEVALNLASNSGIAALGALNPIIQLSLAMQLSLVARRGRQSDVALVIVTFAVAFALSILNNQKQLAFLVIVTGAVHIVAYRIRIKPQFLISGLLFLVVAFLYIAPLIQIVRSMNVEKSARVGVTLDLLQEANFNPIELLEIQSKLPSAIDNSSLAKRLDYLAPNFLNTDRFTQIMPIDQTARASFRAPLGINDYLADLVFETLPKVIVGEHTLEVLDDKIAWRFSIREDGVISRPVLGLLGTGYGVAGAFGVLVLAPLTTLIFFAFMRLWCNGSIWNNPWAVFIASSTFFYGETDLTLLVAIFRAVMPMLVIAWTLIALHRVFKKA